MEIINSQRRNLRGRKNCKLRRWRVSATETVESNLQLRRWTAKCGTLQTASGKQENVLQFQDVWLLRDAFENHEKHPTTVDCGRLAKNHRTTEIKKIIRKRSQKEHFYLKNRKYSDLRKVKKKKN